MEDPRKYYCTSVDDAKTSIKRCVDIDVLEAALVGEMGRGNRKTMVRALEQRISALKAAGEKC